jgi:hypothetical protein
MIWFARVFHRAEIGSALRSQLSWSLFKQLINGILLAPHLDAAFNHGFITVADDGAIVVSDALDADARATLGLDRPLRVRGLADGHRAYLPWHRERVFRQGLAPAR